MGYLKTLINELILFLFLLNPRTVELLYMNVVEVLQIKRKSYQR